MADETALLSNVERRKYEFMKKNKPALTGKKRLLNLKKLLLKRIWNHQMIIAKQL